MRERIFDAKFTTKAEGKGEGLAIVAHYIEMLNATLEVEDNSPCGSCFSLHLKPSHPSLTPRYPSQQPYLSSPPNMPPALRILVVEDNPMLGDLIVTTLESQGHTATHVCEAKQTQDIHAHFDLAIIDLNLPDMPGAQLIHELNGTTQVNRVMSISGEDASHTLPQQRWRSHLRKPFTPNELLEAIALSFKD